MNEQNQVIRCPLCNHVSTVRVEVVEGETDNDQPARPFFICQNPRCRVERIYSSTAVEIGGRR